MSELERVVAEREQFAQGLGESRLRTALLKGKGGYCAEPLPEVVSDALGCVRQYIERAPQGPLRLAVSELGDEGGEEVLSAFLRWGVYPAHDMTGEVRNALGMRFFNLFELIAGLPEVEIPADEVALPPPQMGRLRQFEMSEEDVFGLQALFGGQNSRVGLTEGLVSMMEGRRLGESCSSSSSVTLEMAGLTLEEGDATLLEKVAAGASSGELRMVIGQGGVVTDVVIERVRQLEGEKGDRIRRVIQEYTREEIMTESKLWSIAGGAQTLTRIRNKVEADPITPPERRGCQVLLEVAKQEPRLLSMLESKTHSIPSQMDMFAIVMDLLTLGRQDTLPKALNTLIDQFGLKLHEACREIPAIHCLITDKRASDEALFYFCQAAARGGVLAQIASCTWEGQTAFELAKQHRPECVAYYLTRTSADHPVWGIK